MSPTQQPEITATLNGPTSPSELAFDGYRSLLASARSERARLLTSARSRARSYSKKIRLAAFNQGYHEGLTAGGEACRSAIDALRKHYIAALEVASSDATIIAQQIVSSLIDGWIERNPETLTAWIERALEHLRDVRPLTLRYNPRYHDTIGSCARSCDPTIRLERDQSLGERDFSLDTPLGGVSFSWRELLRSLPAARECVT
jgi:hypothetical protein